MAQGDVLVEYSQHEGNVNDGVWVDEENVITVSSDYTLQKWNLNGVKDYEISFSGQLHEVDVNGDQTQAIIGMYKNIGIADLTNQIVEKEITGIFPSTIYDIKYYDNYSKAICTGAHEKVNIIDLNTGDIVSSFEPGVYPNYTIAEFGLSETRKEVLTPCDAYFIITNIETGDELFSEYVKSSLGVPCCDVSNDEELFAYPYNYDDDYLRIRDYETKNIILSKQLSSPINKIDFSPDDKYVICAHYDDNMISIIEIETGNVYYQYSFNGPIFVKFSPDRTKIISGSTNDIAQIWESGLNPPPIDVTLTMPGYYSSRIMMNDISEESTTEIDGYYSKPIMFDMARIVDIFRKVLDVNPQITRKAKEEKLEITRVADSKTLDIVKVGDAYE